MGDIKVTFWGICTYIEAHQRMVLVNAGDSAIIGGNPKLAGRGIDPHHARLHIRLEDLVSIGPLTVHSVSAIGHIRLNLGQVTLSIANTMEPRLLDRQNQCLPHLDPLAKGELGPPNEATEHGNDTMSCFFNIDSGVLAGRAASNGGAGVNILTVQTLGDPQLTITKFSGGPTMEIRLRSGASVLITNLPDLDEKGADRDADFLLHYLTAGSIPTDAGAPATVDCPPEDIDDAGAPMFVSAGCSNSNYP